MRKTITAVALAAAVLAPTAAVAQTEMSANVGWVSQYYYRGIAQSLSSASAGFDVAMGDLYFGTWGADVGAGTEYDLYAGYGLALGEDMSLTLGGTGYFYTDDAFDTPYIEANIGFGFGPLTVDYAAGKHAGAEYSFLALGASQGAWWATAGAFGTDYVFADFFDAGRYLEVGYGFSAADLDFSTSAIWTDTFNAAITTSPPSTQSNLALVFGVSKTFSVD